MSVMSERPKKARGRIPKRKPGQRSGKPLNVWLPEELRDAMDELTQQTRRSLTAEVCLALEGHLKQHGLWPPPASPAPGDKED